MKPWALLWLLCALGCDANVVDAVRQPIPLPSSSAQPEPDPTPEGGSGGAAEMPEPMPRKPLEELLIHRYSFDGSTDVIVDSKGAAHGTLMGTKQPGTGLLPLAGGTTDQYVNLPNGLVSGLSSATFEAWLTWEGGDAWQRIFDFGSNSVGEDMQGPNGRSYLFLTTAAAPDTVRNIPALLRTSYSQKGVNDEEICSGPSAFPVGTATHIALVIDRAAQTMSMYLDGSSVADCPLTRPLSAISDVNNWLGRSNFEADSEFAGTYDEFRIYDAALTAKELADSFAAGPNAGR